MGAFYHASSKISKWTDFCNRGVWRLQSQIFCRNVNPTHHEVTCSALMRTNSRLQYQDP